jgi:hypothetical protein
MSGMATSIDEQVEGLEQDGAESFFVGGENAGSGGEAAPAYETTEELEVGLLDMNPVNIGGREVSPLALLSGAILVIGVGAYFVGGASD